MAQVRDLQRVNWVALCERWTGSALSWNHLRTAVSKFLTDELGDRRHDFRRRLITTEKFPLRQEVERVPDLPVELFGAVVRKAPRHV